MPVELAGIGLKRIHRITTLEQADFVSHRIPGLEGNVVQNMGRDSVHLEIEGIFYGATAKEDMESLRQAHKAKDPVDFLAEIVGQAYFAQVILKRFEVFQIAQEPDQFSYILTIAEYVEPPEPAGPPGLSDVDADILDEAQNFMDIATLPDMLGSIPEVTNPLEPLSGALDQVEKATENLPAVSERLKAIFG
jgi:hypothetical protein